MLDAAPFERTALPSLGEFQNPEFSRGRPLTVEAVWLLVQFLFIASWIPGSRHRRILLRLFGARIGEGVILKPGVRVKFPWRLVIGDYTWIGEDVWIDNLATVSIGSNCCISQGVYICTGNHDWQKKTFDLVTKEVSIGDGAWIAARCVLAPGVRIGKGAVLGLASVATGGIEDWAIYRGNPAVFAKRREIGLAPYEQFEPGA
jgi:putative colanic acid biosynthesis acetyltransferase WcaF